MRKPSTTALRRIRKLQDWQLTIGLDVGDRSSFYCVLNQAGEVVLEAKVATSPEAIRKTFEKMPASRVARYVASTTARLAQNISEKASR